MAKRTASALKQNRKNAKRRAYNRHFRSACRTAVKKYRAILLDGQASAIEAGLPALVSTVARSAQKGVISRNAANRLIGRLSAQAAAKLAPSA